jgi:hypothetical protein
MHEELGHYYKYKSTGVFSFSKYYHPIASSLLYLNLLSILNTILTFTYSKMVKIVPFFLLAPLAYCAVVAPQVDSSLLPTPSSIVSQPDYTESPILVVITHIHSLLVRMSLFASTNGPSSSVLNVTSTTRFANTTLTGLSTTGSVTLPATSINSPLPTLQPVETAVDAPELGPVV